MAYIGNPISIGNLTRQVFNGGTTGYTLSYSVGSDASLAVYISGVHQVPTTDYSVSGSALTFSSSTPSGTNNICVVYLGLSLDIGTPASGTVGISQLSASGSPSNSNFLRGDNTWSAISTNPSLGSGNEIIRTNSDQINQNITIPSGTNGMSAAPITIGSSYTVTVNGTWTIVGA
jgi:hypothetical protein